MELFSYLTAMLLLSLVVFSSVKCSQKTALISGRSEGGDDILVSASENEDTSVQLSKKKRKHCLGWSVAGGVAVIAGFIYRDYFDTSSLKERLIAIDALKKFIKEYTSRPEMGGSSGAGGGGDMRIIVPETTTTDSSFWSSGNILLWVFVVVVIAGVLLWWCSPIFSRDGAEAGGDGGDQQEQQQLLPPQNALWIQDEKGGFMLVDTFTGKVLKFGDGDGRNFAETTEGSSTSSPIETSDGEAVENMPTTAVKKTSKKKKKKTKDKKKSRSLLEQQQWQQPLLNSAPQNVGFAAPAFPPQFQPQQQPQQLMTFPPTEGPSPRVHKKVKRSKGHHGQQQSSMPQPEQPPAPSAAASPVISLIVQQPPSTGTTFEAQPAYPGEGLQHLDHYPSEHKKKKQKRSHSWKQNSDAHSDLLWQY